MSLIQNYKSKITVKSDGEIRSIFENINNKDTINILTRIGGENCFIETFYRSFKSLETSLRQN